MAGVGLRNRPPSVYGRRNDFGSRKQIFTRMAINGESAKDVAAALSVTPNTAYLTKGRLLEKLRKVVKSLKHL